MTSATENEHDGVRWGPSKSYPNPNARKNLSQLRNVNSCQRLNMFSPGFLNTQTVSKNSLFVTLLSSSAIMLKS